MPTRQYIADFAVNGVRTPYLGMPAGMIQCQDVAELPDDAEVVWLYPKVKRLEQLVRCQALRHVHATLNGDLLPILAQLPALEYLKLSLPRTAEIPSLADLTTLRSLVVCANKHQVDLEFVRGMNWLHSLCISEAVGVTSYEPLATLTELRELYLDGKIRGRATVDTLAPLAKLKHLRFAVLLVRLAKANRTLAPLHKLQELSLLYLSDDYSAEEYDAVVAAIPRLKEIRFNGGKRWPVVPPPTP